MDRAGSQRRWKVWHFIALGVFALAAVGGGCVALIFSLTGPVVTASDNFMTALKDGNFEAAYEMGTPELREELGSAQALEAVFEAGRPESWSWSTRQIQNRTGRVAGRATYSGGGQSDAEIQLLSQGDEWKISGFRMKPQ